MIDFSKPAEIVTTMFSEDGQREAQVFSNGESLFVNMFQRNEQEKLEFVHRVDVTGHSVNYAEDTAENWVTYVIRN
tara:strand:+ start:174 stop:401 length:228 start_codon:yes stop_codon:yes gene_type:complete